MGTNMGLSPNQVVQEAPTISIPLVDTAIENAKFLIAHALVCHFDGFWPHLVDLNSCISKEWNPYLKGEAYIYPHARGFFVVVYDETVDRDYILKFGHWFWGISNLCMQPWTPSFDPATASLSSFPVWVRLPNFPLHLWCLPSLQAIGNALGKFYYRNLETKETTITTYAKICVEMDFSKGFPMEINLTSMDYLWTQSLIMKMFFSPVESSLTQDI